MARASTYQRLLLCATQIRIAMSCLQDWEDAERAHLHRAYVLICEEIGPTVPKRVAARVLAVDVSSLDRWIARGAIDTGARPGSTRQEISTTMTVELAFHLRRWRRQRPPDALRLALARVWQARYQQHSERELALADLS
jgi:hypothetical protein